MAEQLIDRALYDAILRFEDSEDAQDYYYKVMDTETVTRSGRRETVRTRILKVYAMLFCEDMDAPPGTPAGPDEVEATADRLYIGEMGLDPSHWYRMRYHFPVIDEDNYDRFAALVISDLSAGPLREAIEKGGDMLLVGEADPLRMTEKQRREQHLRVIDMGGGEASL
ncbi:MAG: hypothetical protein IJR97_03330 [Clostridia bacterium]|nr:hypothetical protein [Clostridia bacterium]